MAFVQIHTNAVTMIFCQSINILANKMHSYEHICFTKKEHYIPQNKIIM